jgi:hypothetical protein
MLAINCPCGHRLQAPDRDALFAAAREHIERGHPDMERSDDQIRARIEADTCEVENVA